jgi:RNA polymerase sigma factor (sigma-70 family)
LDRLRTGTGTEINLTLEELQCLLGGDLSKYVSRYFSQRDEIFIEELLQQTWHKVWSQASQCRGLDRRSILAWVKQIARRTGINMVRDGKKLEHFISLEELSASEDEDAPPWDESTVSAPVRWGAQPLSIRPTEDEISLGELIQEGRRRLTDRQYEVFLLCLYESSKSSIAKILEISEQRVGQIIDQINTRFTKGDAPFMK